MSTWNRFLPKALSAEAERARMTPQVGASVYKNPTLLQQLADEMDYSPQLPRTFAAFWKPERESSDVLRERMRESKKPEEFRAKYSQIMREQQAILDNFDPYMVPIEVVILAKQTVEAAREYLAKIPEGRESSSDERLAEIKSRAERRAEEIRKLEAWIKRLRVEIGRINSEIDGLTGSAANPYRKSRLEDDIKDIARAILDAQENLGTVNSG